jgi:hypothetical protein
MNEIRMLIKGFEGVEFARDYFWPLGLWGLRKKAHQMPVPWLWISQTPELWGTACPLL